MQGWVTGKCQQGWDLRGLKGEGSVEKAEKVSDKVPFEQNSEAQRGMQGRAQRGQEGACLCGAGVRGCAAVRRWGRCRYSAPSLVKHMSALPELAPCSLPHSKLLHAPAFPHLSVASLSVWPPMSKVWAQLPVSCASHLNPVETLLASLLRTLRVGPPLAADPILCHHLLPALTPGSPPQTALR